MPAACQARVLIHTVAAPIRAAVSLAGLIPCRVEERDTSHRRKVARRDAGDSWIALHAIPLSYLFSIFLPSFQGPVKQGFLDTYHKYFL